jgi:hypothetical protein
MAKGSAADTRITELFGQSTRQPRYTGWVRILQKQTCPFTDSKCFKVRKSQPAISIGTCTVRHGESAIDLIICPNRLLERKQVFTDCIHLLTSHEPGNELHVVSEVSMPGGSVDYFLVSAKRGKVRDFVGIELQALDTTGTVWPDRQRFLAAAGLKVSQRDVRSPKAFGMNWKMTAKTTLVQLHHKVETLEHVGKHLVLVVQDQLLRYLRREFKFDHVSDARLGDAMHIHAYALRPEGAALQIELVERISTDAAGVAACLGIQAETKVELETILAELERRLSPKTLLTLDSKPSPPAHQFPTE